MVHAAYRLPTWSLTPQNTVIIRADCNVPTNNGVILDDARLKALIPTLELIHATDARIIIITHWGRPTSYDPALSTKHIVAWFNAHGLPMAFCAREADIDDTPVIMLENLRFLDDAGADALIERLSALGTHFVHDGFSVMHRDDPFNTLLPLMFVLKNRSLGISAHEEIKKIDDFLSVLKKPALGIFGGAKLASKIDVIESLAGNRCNTVALLPALCFPVLAAHKQAIGKSFKDATSASRIAEFENALRKNNCTLMLPTDFLVSQKGTQPYSVVTTFQPNQVGISFGPQTDALLTHAVHSAGSIILNGFPGFLEHPASLEPYKKLLATLAASKSTHTLIAGGDTYAAVRALGFADQFPYYSLAGGATLDYCAGNRLQGLEALKMS